MSGKQILIIGYGNPGRADDGLGPALAAHLEQLNLPGITVESDYQLTIEHAAMAAQCDAVIFVDAARDTDVIFSLQAITPAPACGFTSHGVTPAEVLMLAYSCFGASPEGYVLGIRAYVLDRFEERLSPEAQKALEAAIEGLLVCLSRPAGAG